ncbi:MAG: hypothetical protein Kow00127_20100 [Bacteroidales bacterium]
MSDIIKIPKQFYSDLTGKPFEKCSLCNGDLGVPLSEYIVEKVMIRSSAGSLNTLYEFALCAGCQQKMQDAMSDFSKQRITEFMRRNIIPESILPESESGWSLKDKMSRCVLSGKELKELEEFHIACKCSGGFMLTFPPPFVVDTRLLEPLEEQLSAETREEFDSFKERLSSPAPDLEELFRETGLLII